MPLDFVSTADAHERFQGLFDPTDVLGAWLPTDGWLNPSDPAMAPAAVHAAGGAEIARTPGSPASASRSATAGAARTSTPTGAASRDVAERGRHLRPRVARPASTCPWWRWRQFAITRPPDHPGRPAHHAHPDRLVYVREEVGGLIMGGYERNPDPWCVSGSVLADFNNRLLAPTGTDSSKLSEAAEALVPRLGDAEVHQLVNGPEAFTPDGEFILGESDVRGFFVAAGFCAHGIAGAGGNGQVRRSGSSAASLPAICGRWTSGGSATSTARGYALARTYEVYSTYYDIVYPNHERLAGRPLRESPLYSRHEEGGVRREERLGAGQPLHLERRRNARAPAAARAGQHWSTAIVTEHLATCHTAGLFDESSFAKIEVAGPGAVAFLQHLCVNDVDRAVGSVVYTSMLNSRRHRVRLHGDPAGGRAFPHRHGHRLCPPRPVGSAARARRRHGLGTRRDVVDGMPGAVGSVGAEHPGRRLRR